MSSSQVHDWLKERYAGEYYGKDRTVRAYVQQLRIQHKILKSVPSRQYQAMSDPPMGHQAQVDFGEKVVSKPDGTTVKLYCMALILSHSRYKYAEWWDRPLTTAKLIEMLNHAFEYLGGAPQELVFDQDKIVAVSENYGDVIYTREFEQYRQNLKFKVHLCRAADPESKGRVEAVVKYVKNNFAAHRTYVDLASFNEDCLEWLKRTGNAIIHGITKRIPAEVFLLEKQYLQPISPLKYTPDNILTRGIRKDNTILYASNRYSVPLGTYRPGKKLAITIEDNNLVIVDTETNQVIAIHKRCYLRGQLIQNNNHLRDHTGKIAGLQEQLQALLGTDSAAETFLAMIKKDKPRYIRDQFLLIRSVISKSLPDVVRNAVKYCTENELWSAVDFRAAVEHYQQANIDTPIMTTVGPMAVSPAYKIKTASRDIKEYTAVYGGDR